jgi:hypothetical protein
LHYLQFTVKTCNLLRHDQSLFEGSFTCFVDLEITIDNHVLLVTEVGYVLFEVHIFLLELFVANRLSSVFVFEVIKDPVLN